MDEVFGLNLLKKEKVSISKEIKELVKQREIARKNKDYKTSDSIRNKINKFGYIINDTNKGSVVRKKNGW